MLCERGHKFVSGDDESYAECKRNGRMVPIEKRNGVLCHRHVYQEEPRQRLTRIT